MAPLSRGRPIEVRLDDVAGSPSRHTLFNLHKMAGGQSLFVGFHLFGTVDEIELPEPVVMRLACHAIIQQLPEEALKEATEELSEMYEFYSRPVPPPKPLPPAPKSVPVKMGATVVRPVFPITDEE